MNQREKLKKLVIDFCNEKGSRTFSLQELHERYGHYDVIGVGGDTPEATVRRLLQELRDEHFISFLEKSGNYTLRGIQLLDREKEDIGNIDLSMEEPNKREHLVETYARNVQWAKAAKAKLGVFCMIENCTNTFLKPDRQRYIEVHHIIPLYQGGEDTLLNLSVLCAHHHRMAHFAQDSDIENMQQLLLRETERRLRNPD